MDFSLAELGVLVSGLWGLRGAGWSHFWFLVGRLEVKLFRQFQFLFLFLEFARVCWLWQLRGNVISYLREFGREFSWLVGWLVVVDPGGG